MIEIVEHFAAMSAAAAAAGGGGSSSSLIMLRSVAVATQQQQSRNDHGTCCSLGRIRGAAAQQSHKSSGAALKDFAATSKDYFCNLGTILSQSKAESYSVGILARPLRWPREIGSVNSNRLRRESKICSLRPERGNDTKLSGHWWRWLDVCPRAKVSNMFWIEAVTTTAYISNRRPTKALKDKAPYEAWYEEERPRMNATQHSEDSNGSCLSKAADETSGHTNSSVEDLLPKLDAVVVEAAEIVAETVEVAVQTVSSVGEIEGPIPPEQPVVDREAAVKTVGFWVCAAVAFGFTIGLKDGTGKASEFLAGYLVEQSLSVDNLFVFVLIFKYFRVPNPFQSRVLTYGIFGAIICRATMILLGVVTLQSFEAVNLLFAGVLLFSSYKILTEGEDEEDDLSNNYIVNSCRKFIPVTAAYDGNKFFTTSEGVRKATPLLLTLVVVELSDIVFAVDSIPAVFGVTRDPFIVFSSNIFAILGLRSLYTLISGSMDELDYLQPSVAMVLGFIGSKMVVDFFGFHVPTEVSLVVVFSIIGAGISLSLLKKGGK